MYTSNYLTRSTNGARGAEFHGFPQGAPLKWLADHTSSIADVSTYMVRYMVVHTILHDLILDLVLRGCKVPEHGANVAGSRNDRVQSGFS